jgi:4-alpha-glucanotransferase
VNSTLPSERAVTDPARAGFRAPFRPGYRASGILLHVTSLPSRYGIGDVGPSAFAWMDRLAAAGQAWWQVLPLGPTGTAIRPIKRCRRSWPIRSSSARSNWRRTACSSRAIAKIVPFLPTTSTSKGSLRSRNGCSAGKTSGAGRARTCAARSSSFVRKRPLCRRSPRCSWLCGPSTRERLFVSGRPGWPGVNQRLSEGESGVGRCHRPIPLRPVHPPSALAITQGVRQRARDKAVGRSSHLRLSGFVGRVGQPRAVPDGRPLDSAGRRRRSSGLFQRPGPALGQPHLRLEALRQIGYRWWIDRLQARLPYLDAIRVDHFRGFEAAWHVPAGAPTAVSGHWAAGPGADFFDKAQRALGGLPLLAEDLRVITPAVTALRDQFQLPGMRVLQFAFNGDPNDPHLPDHYVHNSAVYTGTHDNDTTRGWYDTLPEHERRNLWSYLQRPAAEPHEATWELIRLAWSSVAALAITPLQDLLGLGSAAVQGRTNRVFVAEAAQGAGSSGRRGAGGRSRRALGGGAHRC